ncbi:MAG: hypothetical protein ACLTAI_02605 [Thomasclavelia sp.]
MQVTDEDLENVVPAVADEFKAALEMKLMQFIAMLAASSKKMLMHAFDRLASAMHMLGLRTKVTKQH